LEETPFIQAGLRVDGISQGFREISGIGPNKPDLVPDISVIVCLGCKKFAINRWQGILVSLHGL
jgi:hypothetical protein